MSKKHHIISVITTILGYRVIVDNDSFIHAQKHFLLPQDIFLELLERILKDPTIVYLEELEQVKFYHHFYRLESKRYLLVVIKITDDGAYFCSMYTTGEKIKSKHTKLKKVKL